MARLPVCPPACPRLLRVPAHTRRPYGRRCHKPNYVDISLAQLVNFVATNPALRPLIITTSSISALGRPGCDVAPDKFVESINKMIEGREGAEGSFATKLFSGPELVALSHVAHVRAPLLPCPPALACPRRH